MNEQQQVTPLTSVHTQLRVAALEMAIGHVKGTDKDPMQFATQFYNFLIGETK